MKFTMQLAVVICSTWVLGCALGDGRGFATVDGSLSVTMDSGDPPSLDSFEVTVGTLELDGTTITAGYGKEEFTSSLAIGLTSTPLDGATPAPFGPFEVDSGPYSRISVVISKISLSGELGGSSFSLVVKPEGGLRVSAEADLPVNRDELPLISISAVLTLSNNVLGGVDVSKGADTAAAQIAQNVEDGAQLSATWVRRGD
jgi:hypothetical protein